MKLRFKYLFTFFLLLAVLSCEVRLEDNTRVLVEGKIIDQDNLPIVDAKISVLTRRGNFSGGQNQFILGEGYSTLDGTFSVVSFYNKDEDFAIEINAGENYGTYIYKTNTLDFTPSDLTFNLETVRLKRLANFNYNIVRTSGEGNSISFRFKYNEGFCLEYYEGTTLNELQSICFEEHILNRALNDGNPDAESVLRVPLDESIEFVYTINNGSEITEIITINEENYDFTFNY
ncbi:hypothetical protein [Winogradskyella undariae]|uniref:hypothetical protein n=1 Tax=Winogradskyella undariae TaxID=1285465 RepID=UPI0015C75E94|nr:hypothetical protein [Winogradskyella undariae]